MSQPSPKHWRAPWASTSGCWRLPVRAAVRISWPATTPAANDRAGPSEPSGSAAARPDQGGRQRHRGHGIPLRLQRQAELHEAVAGTASASGMASPRRSASASASTGHGEPSVSAYRGDLLGVHQARRRDRRRPRTPQLLVGQLKSIGYPCPAGTNTARSSSSSKSTRWLHRQARSYVVDSTPSRFATSRVPSSFDQADRQRVLEGRHLRVPHDDVRVHRAAAARLQRAHSSEPQTAQARSAGWRSVPHQVQCSVGGSGHRATSNQVAFPASRPAAGAGRGGFLTGGRYLRMRKRMVATGTPGVVERLHLVDQSRPTGHVSVGDRHVVEPRVDEAPVPVPVRSGSDRLDDERTRSRSPTTRDGRSPAHSWSRRPRSGPRHRAGPSSSRSAPSPARRPRARASSHTRGPAGPAWSRPAASWPGRSAVVSVARAASSARTPGCDRPWPRPVPDHRDVHLVGAKLGARPSARPAWPTRAVVREGRSSWNRASGRCPTPAAPGVTAPPGHPRPAVATITRHRRHPAPERVDLPWLPVASTRPRAPHRASPAGGAAAPRTPRAGGSPR